MSGHDKCEGMEAEPSKTHSYLDDELKRLRDATIPERSGDVSFEQLAEASPEWLNDKLSELRETLERGPLPILTLMRRRSTPVDASSSKPASSASSAAPDPFGLIAALTETFPAARVIASADGTYANAQLEGRSVSLNKTGSIIVASVYSETLVEAQSGENAAVALRLLFSERAFRALFPTPSSDFTPHEE